MANALNLRDEVAYSRAQREGSLAIHADNFCLFAEVCVWHVAAPVAVLLGALHGLEPGHSKTMMAAFIIAVRGTI
ncbi:MAG: hypothetical protein ABL907_00830, partial [Hyphomicrobium sp.]